MAAATAQTRALEYDIHLVVMIYSKLSLVVPNQQVTFSLRGHLKRLSLWRLSWPQIGSLISTQVELLKALEIAQMDRAQNLCALCERNKWPIFFSAKCCTRKIR